MTDWRCTEWRDFVVYRGETAPISAEARLDVSSAREPYGIFTIMAPPPVLNPMARPTRYLVQRTYFERDGEALLGMVVFHGGDVNVWTTNYVWYIERRDDKETIKAIRRNPP